jgi:2-dehydro-3-deoxygalactonokinase
VAKPEWIAVDWGTSNVRAWGIGPDGSTLFERASPEGMGKLGPTDYPAVFEKLIGAEVQGKGPFDVLICGMAGARQGWREAPYLETPADLHAIARKAVKPPMRGTKFRPRILPGVCQRGGAEDVMRGEETQLLGLSALRAGFSGTVVMPGTHSKWARLASGRVEKFATAMTGELFDLLGTHSVLRHSLGGEQTGPATEDGVDAGLSAGLATPGQLTSLLFRTRAASLLSQKGADWCAGYLSGLLVGAEIGGKRDWIEDAPIPLIGSARLCRLYAAALARIGAHSETIDATTATLAGLSAARRQGS